MRIVAAKIKNYRSIEKVSLDFPSLYAAICGPNDSGKTNVVRALRAIASGESSDSYLFPDDDELMKKEDYPKWLDTEPSRQEMSFELMIELDKHRDIGLHQFFTTQLKIENEPQTLEAKIATSYSPDHPKPKVEVMIRGQSHTGIQAEQVLEKLQSSKSILFHNSITSETRYLYSRRSMVGHIKDITGRHEALIDSMKSKVTSGLAKISKAQQAELQALLGRLQTKYRVGLSLAPFDLTYLPFSLTLGDKSVEVPLQDWGSGTRNRTMILLALFRARQISSSDPSASKVTPVLIIEEPESFLHPSAQAEFGRVLQDLSEEFQVQVIVTTHSPYLLNLRDPASNILLNRHVSNTRMRGTERVDTAGENWMAPFGKALEVDAEDFRPWKAMVFSTSNCLLLVEGDIDKEYIKLLCNADHGPNRLCVTCDIIPYGGTGSLSNTVLLKFIKNRYNRFFVTFGLDAADRVEKSLKSLQLEKHRHYAPVGRDLPGKRCIEGLLPDTVVKAVYEANADLVQAATSGKKEEQESAKANLKRALLERFKAVAVPGPDFEKFYPLARLINKALA